MLLAMLLAVPLGILSALRRNSLLDSCAMTFALSGQCMPTFWLGILLILVFGVNLGWVPVYGGEGLRALALPAARLGVFAFAPPAPNTPSRTLEGLPQDFLCAARAKGINQWSVMPRHGVGHGG